MRRCSIHPRESQPSPARLVFQALKSYLEEQKFEIFLVTPDCYTIRAKFPEGYKYQGVADFVMARKEVGYIPNTRTPIVVSMMICHVEILLSMLWLKTLILEKLLIILEVLKILRRNSITPYCNFR